MNRALITDCASPPPAQVTRSVWVREKLGVTFLTGCGETHIVPSTWKPEEGGLLQV